MATRVVGLRALSTTPGVVTLCVQAMHSKDLQRACNPLLHPPPNIAARAVRDKVLTSVRRRAAAELAR
jgi:hypothetical protein